MELIETNPLRGDIRDIPREEILRVAAELPKRTGEYLIRDYDKQIVEDYVGSQFRVVPGEGTKRHALVKRKPKTDFTLDELVDLAAARVRNFDAMLAKAHISDERLRRQMPGQNKSLARADLEAALHASFLADSWKHQGPGQAGSKTTKFPTEISAVNAVQYMDDINRDRLYGTYIVDPQGGHILDEAHYPEEARNLSNIRGQEGYVNWKDGGTTQMSPERRVAHLTEGRVESMQDLAGLLARAEAEGVSDRKKEKILNILMTLGDSNNAVNEALGTAPKPKRRMAKALLR